MTEIKIREKVVAAAMEYLGIREGSAAHKKIIAFYNSYKPRPRGYVLQEKDPWCAAFASAIAIICELTDIIPIECSCSKLIELAKQMGCWQEADDYIPQAADLALYDWDDDGKGDNIGAPDHVGIVKTVAGGVIYVIEGNYRDAVNIRKVPVNGKNLRGFITPDYASKADLKTVDELAQEVIKGRWGNGQERKDKLTAAGYNADAVQDRVNELLDRTYTVKKGDTLWGIAEEKLGYGRRFVEIKKLNGLSDDIIYPGQVLKLPEK